VSLINRQFRSEEKTFNTTGWVQMPPTSTSINKTYKLKVEGTYGVENNINHLDAAFQSPLSTQVIGTGTTALITNGSNK
jgi:hypothetical protein